MDKTQPKIEIRHLWNRSYGIDRTTPQGPDGKPFSVSAETWLTLVADAIKAFRKTTQSPPADEICWRVTLDPESDPLLQGLPAIGFQKKLDRIEFRQELSKLPDDTGTPLTWLPVQEAGPHTVETAATLMKAAAVGDPDFDPDEDALGCIKGYLADSTLRTDLNCIQMGFFEGKQAALCIAQVDPSSGWSRITYMCVLPEFRGKDLGKWVHRHGFAMMKAQGGILYHGGTVATNTAMLRLFESHGCPVYRQMQEWVYPCH